LTILNYIHLNPIKAGLVKRISDYKWSSIKEYKNEENKILINFEHLKKIDLTRRQYLIQLKELIKIKYNIELPKTSNHNLVYGSKKFVNEILKLTDRRQESKEIDNLKRWKDKKNKRIYNKEFILDCLILFYNIKTKKTKNLKVFLKYNFQTFLCYFLNEFSSLSKTEIANFIGKIQRSAVSMSIKRLSETRLKSEKLNDELLKFELFLSSKCDGVTACPQIK